MEIPAAIFRQEAKKLHFDATDITDQIESLGKAHLYFFARIEAKPPWEESKEQFQFKFLTFYDDKKGQIVIEGVSAALVDTSTKRTKPLSEKSFWTASEGKLPTKETMMDEVMKQKKQKLEPVEKVRKQFDMGTESANVRIPSPVNRKSKSVRG